MKLAETVDLMLSDDWKDRFKAEYYQAVIRALRLGKVVSHYYNNKLDVELSSGIEWHENQLRIMMDYIDILKKRAENEGIKL